MILSQLCCCLVAGPEIVGFQETSPLGVGSIQAPGTAFYLGAKVEMGDVLIAAMVLNLFGLSAPHHIWT